MIWENIKMAGRSIAGNKLRTFLTMLGIIIGVSAVVTINSIGQGLKNQVGSQVTDLGSNIIFVTPGQVISNSGGKSSFNPASSVGTSTLTSKDVDSIKNTQHVVDVTYLSLISGIASHNQTQDPSALLIATTPSYSKVLQNQKIDKGRFIEDADTKADVVVLGSATRDSLFGKDASAVDQTVEIRGTSFKVIGVMKSSDNGSALSSSGSLDSAVYLPTGSAEALTGSNLSIYRIAANIDDSQNVDSVVGRLKDELKNNHGGQEDFSVLTQKDLLSTINTILNALTSSIAAIASIALLVGGIGIMNIMLVSVTERTREIGLRKALGATSRMVLGQFLIEAVALTVLGGLLGLGLSLIGANVAGKLIKITPVFTPGIILTAFLISVAVGIIFGIAPALKAARMRPIDALRYE
jgi:putative ABC transport system permease protein